MAFGDTQFTTRPQRVRLTKKFNSAFWQWFGESKIVNPEDGSPRVVYHGTATEILFTAFHVPEMELGIHFGTQDQAAKFVNIDSEGSRIYPLYASIQRPYRMEDSGSWYAQAIYNKLSDNRYHLIRDGIFPDATHMDEYLEKYKRAVAKTVRTRTAAQKMRTIHREIGSAATRSKLLKAEQARDNAQTEKFELQRQEIVFLRNLLMSKGYDGVVYVNQHEGAELPIEEQAGSKIDPSTLDWTLQKPSKSKKGKKKRRPEIRKEDSYIVWNPGQIKSATGNRGTWDLNDPDILHGIGFGGLRSR